MRRLFALAAAVIWIVPAFATSGTGSQTARVNVSGTVDSWISVTDGVATIALGDIHPGVDVATLPNHSTTLTAQTNIVNGATASITGGTANVTGLTGPAWLSASVSPSAAGSVVAGATPTTLTVSLSGTVLWTQAPGSIGGYFTVTVQSN